MAQSVIGDRGGSYLQEMPERALLLEAYAAPR
jgi:hypothetical protein